MTNNSGELYELVNKLEDIEKQLKRRTIVEFLEYIIALSLGIYFSDNIITFIDNLFK